MSWRCRPPVTGTLLAGLKPDKAAVPIMSVNAKDETLA
jgi:hypothetical protein